MRIIMSSILLGLSLVAIGCEKKVVVEIPQEGTTESEEAEIVVSHDIPKVNRKLRKLKTNLQNTMDKRESLIDKKLPSH